MSNLAARTMRQMQHRKRVSNIAREWKEGMEEQEQISEDIDNIHFFVLEVHGIHPSLSPSFVPSPTALSPFVLRTNTNPANCYKNINPEDAIGSFRQAATLLMELGKFKQIGKIHKDIAEIYEKEGSYDEGKEGEREGRSGTWE